MAETLASRMTSKGQVTVPKTARRELGVGPGDLVEFKEIDGRWFIEKRASQVERFFGFVSPHARPEHWPSIRQEVERDLAREVASEA